MTAKNNSTGVVHALTGRKVGPAQLYETLCGHESGLGWLKTEEPITCTKCESILAYSLYKQAQAA
ncbi:MAG: hypothetical protein AMJ56_07580 [Anaerolineae bacterium SG8_19]|nr:MAG: hypothetical protein AMJ56_07580 [Anaerolineae bacterium SG8_19]